MEELQAYITKQENKIKEMDILEKNFQANLDRLSHLIADNTLASFTGTGDVAEIKRKQAQTLEEIRAYDARLKSCEKDCAIILPALSVARIMAQNPEKYSIIIDNFTKWEEFQARECERLRKLQHTATPKDFT